MSVARFLLLCALALLAGGARAHESRPAYLEITESAPGRYDVLWRTPSLSGMRLPVTLKFPDGTRNVTEPAQSQLSDSIIERWLVEAGGGLTGHLDYAGDLFDRATAERLARRFVHLVRSALDDPDRPVDELAFEPPAPVPIGVKGGAGGMELMAGLVKVMTFLSGLKPADPPVPGLPGASGRPALAAVPKLYFLFAGCASLVAGATLCTTRGESR